MWLLICRYFCKSPSQFPLVKSYTMMKVQLQQPFQFDTPEEDHNRGTVEGYTMGLQRPKLGL